MSAPSVNACTLCKKGKRKCSKTRPSCAICTRLRRKCVYIEDTIQTSFETEKTEAPQVKPDLPPWSLNDALLSAGLFSIDDLHKSTASLVLRIIGTRENMLLIATDFFNTTHQRISALSKIRFQRDLDTLTTAPRADFAVLCLAILLVQQYPPSDKPPVMQTPRYLTVKIMISLLETTGTPTLDLAQCRVLVSFFEMGHGLHAAAYISIAACARSARALGLHRKPWLHPSHTTNRLLAEEQKRTWWAIANMDRFISLCNGDALFVTEDPERTDPLPIEDLMWSEAADPSELDEALVAAPPAMDTPFSVTVGQMARESQIAYLAGRVVRHVFDPTSDPDFNAEEAAQLERTLNSYLPLLADEELRIGKYCGAFGVCNSALFTLYDFMLRHGTHSPTERARILHSIETASLRSIAFAEASYGQHRDVHGFEIYSPYLPYSLCQAAIVQYRLWKHDGDARHKAQLDSARGLVLSFTKRWAVAWQYLDIIDRLHDEEPSTTVPFQGSFISTGRELI